MKFVINPVINDHSIYAKKKEKFRKNIFFSSLLAAQKGDNFLIY